MANQEFIVEKRIEFDYGHRVWSQKLNKKMSLDSACVCRHLHGHRGVIIPKLSAKKLKKGMVTDFKHFNFFKKWIDDHIDHKFLIDVNDPLIHVIIPVLHKIELKKHPYHHSIARENWMSDLEWELFESFTIVDFVPTSENMSKWFYDILQNELKKFGINVHSMEFKETPKTACNYIPKNKKTKK